MIQLTNVSKRYMRQLALKDITLELPLGKIIGIVGENGSGKSTLLKLIAGLAQPTSGALIVNGEEANRRFSKYVSYFPVNNFFYPSYTVEEAIAFQASQYIDFNIVKAQEIMKTMQLEPDKKIRDLSLGNRGRLRIVLTLAREVPYILLDEPLSGLDPMVREAIVKGMLTYVDLDSQTLVMTTHEITEIETILDSFIAIKNGELLRMANVEELHEQEGLGIIEWMKKSYV